MPKVKIYTTPTCPYCNMAKDYLAKKGAEVEEIDLSADSRLVDELVSKTGQLGVPQIEYQGRFVIGFDKEKLNELLGF